MSEQNALDENLSSFSPSVLQHQGIRALSTDKSEALWDLSDEEIEAFALLRSLNHSIHMPMTMMIISEQGSLSRARNRQGRIEYAGCYKSYPPVVPVSTPLMGTPQQGEQKPGLLKKLFGRKKQETEQ